MGRCGCAAACGCFVIGANGIEVSGSGSLVDPYKVEIAKTQPWGDLACGQVGVCVADMGGGDTGLIGGDGKLRVAISPKVGNTLSISPADGGLYKLGSDPAPPRSPDCSVTVAGLPTTRLTFGRSGFGENVMPWHTAKAVRAAVDVRLDAVQINVACLGDGTAVLAPYNKFGTDTDAGDSTLPGVGSSWTNDGAVMTGFSYLEIGISQWKTLIIQKDNWFKGAEYLQMGADTVSEMLNEVAGKLVIAYTLPTGPDINSTGLMAATCPALLKAIQRACVEKSSIVLARRRYLDVLPARAGVNFAAAGVEMGVLIDFTSDLASNVPADLVAAGIKWVFIQQSIGTTTGQGADAYVAAGLSVIYLGMQRRVQLGTEAAHGVRGVCATDPQYYRSMVPPLTKDTWPINIGGAGGSEAYMSGQLHEGVSTYTYRPPEVRGFGTQAAGLWDGGWALPFTGRASSSIASSIVLGWACPLPDPTTWDMEWEVQFVTGAGVDSNTAAILTSLPDDANITHTNPNVVTKKYSYIYVRRNGTMGIISYFGVPTGLNQLTESAGTALVVGTWYKFRLQVSPMLITFSMFTRTGGPTFEKTIAQGLPLHRQPYIGLAQSGDALQANTPVVAFRNVRINAAND
jgi:hypothetical protein